MAVAAHAESEGDPFPFRTPGVTVFTPQAYLDAGSAAYPDLLNRHSRTLIAGGLGLDAAPATGSEGIVQTANSLPRGFAQSTAAYAHNRSVQRNFAEQAAQPSRASR